MQVLRDPKQKRFFKSKDIHDLFTLGPQHAGASETASIFSSLHGGLEVPLDPDSLAVPAQRSQPVQAGEQRFSGTLYSCGHPQSRKQLSMRKSSSRWGRIMHASEIASSLHGHLEVPLDPDCAAVPAESSQPA